MSNVIWKIFLTLRGVVSFPCPNLRFVGHALDLDSYSSKLTVARFIGRIVTQTVLRADFGGHQRKRCASVLQARRQKILSIARLGKNFLAASLQDARAAFALVATEIGTQYSLGYYPTNKARDGKFRTIRVEVQGVSDKPQVRAREGYYAPKS